MYCGNCGTQIDDAALFCPACGERTEATDTSTPTQPKAGSKKLAWLLGSIGGVILIVVLIIALGGGYKKTLHNYYKAFENQDAELMYNSVFAQYWIDYEEEGFGEPYAMQSIKQHISDNLDHWDCGDNIKISYKILDEKRATEEDLEDLEENIFDWYAYYVYSRDEFSITDAYVLDIEFTVTGDEGTDTFYYPDGFLIIKENGNWRIPRGQINCSFYSNQ